jgi:uncharacterized protein (TIGR03437 family)
VHPEYDFQTKEDSSLNFLDPWTPCKHLAVRSDIAQRASGPAGSRQWKRMTCFASKGSWAGLAIVTMLAAVPAAEAQPAIAGIANAAPLSARTGNAARGELISIYGTNLATGVASAFAPVTPVLSLAGASVTIGGIAAAILYASPNQLDVQVPFEITAGTASVNVVVTVANNSTTPVTLSLLPADPGLEYVQAGAQVFAPTARNTAAIQAPVGTMVTLIATGLGSVTPSIPSGLVPPFGTVYSVITPPSVTLDGRAVPVVSAQLVALGVYAVGVVIPPHDKGTVVVELGGKEKAGCPAGLTVSTDSAAAVFGDGSDGELHISTDADWVSTAAGGTLQFTSVRVDAGSTLTVPSGTIVRATGSVTLLGKIVVAPNRVAGAGIGSSFAATGRGGAPAAGGAAVNPTLAALLVNPGVAGGGAGGSDGGSPTAGGGTLVIVAGGPIEVESGGSIQADGENGGGASAARGGGGGGIVVLASAAAIANRGRLSAIGGAGGSGSGGGGGGIVHLLAPALTAGILDVAGGEPGAPLRSGEMGGGGGGSGGTGGQSGTEIASPSAGTNGLAFTRITANPAALFLVPVHWR